MFKITLHYAEEQRIQIPRRKMSFMMFWRMPSLGKCLQKIVGLCTVAFYIWKLLAILFVKWLELY